MSLWLSKSEIIDCIVIPDVFGQIVQQVLVPGVYAVKDGFGKPVFPLQPVQKDSLRPGHFKIPNGVKACIRPQRHFGARIDVEKEKKLLFQSG